MNFVINFCFFVFIIAESKTNRTTEIVKDDNHLRLLEQCKQLDEIKWLSLDEGLEKNIADFIKSESGPLGTLFNQETKIDIHYYKKINNFVISRIKILNDELETNFCLDEAFDYLDQETIPSPDLIIKNHEKKKITIDTVQLNDLKTNDFYIHLLKENIQLHHLNMFVFIRQNITSDMKEGCNFLIELVNHNSKKSITRLFRKKLNPKDFKSLHDYWQYIVDIAEPTILTTEQRQNKERVHQIEKIIDIIVNEEKEPDFILLFFQNPKLLNLVIDHIFYTKKKRYICDVCVQPDNVFNYTYYEWAIKTNEKFREHVLYLILKKKEWTKYKFFYIFDNQKFVNKIKSEHKMGC